MGACGRQIASQYTIRVMAQKYLDLYESALSARF
jgi:hypothetical protein